MEVILIPIAIDNPQRPQPIIARIKIIIGTKIAIK